MIKHVLAAMRTLREQIVRDEYELQRTIGQALDRAGIRYEKEANLMPRCRVDFLCDGGICIEVKKGKPASKQLASQVARYAVSDKVRAIVIVVERNVFRVPSQVHGKPVHYVALSANWGIAL